MREDIRIRITPVLREGSFWRSEIPGRRRDVLNSVVGEEKAGKRRWPVSKEKIGGRGHRYKRGNGKNGKSGRYGERRNVLMENSFIKTVYVKLRMIRCCKGNILWFSLLSGLFLCFPPVSEF